MNLDAYRYHFGVYFTNGTDPDTPISIPERLGRIVVSVMETSSDPETTPEQLAFQNCTDQFTWVNLNLTEKSQAAISGGYCLDTSEAYIKGVSTFGK